jgi:predicted dehydrogenase
MSDRKGVNRRDFVRTAMAAGSVASLAAGAAAQNTPAAGAVAGANSRINIGMIGVGGRGSSLLRLILAMAEERGDLQVTAVCDVYEKRKRLAQERSKAPFATLDHRELLARPDVDAVVIATPDHWHGRMALDALDAGKDVYLEKPMCHTIEEARSVTEKVAEKKAVLQVGSQTTSSDQWWKARKVLADGMIGDLLMSQGSYHRNSVGGEWNYNIDPEAGPNGSGDNYIDWNRWLGPAERRAWDPQRYFRFRKFWDYSGGVATDLFYHVVAPLQICWGEPQFPHRVSSGGGIYAFPGREVPDTFNVIADFAKGHSLVLSSSMANDTHIPGLLRGHKGTLVMVDDGKFEGRTDHITVSAQKAFQDEFVAKWGYRAMEIPVEDRGPEAHMANFFQCIRTREKPVLDAATGYRAQVTVSMSVESYRRGQTLYFDPATEKIVDRPPRNA